MSTRVKVAGLTALILLFGIGLGIRGTFNARRQDGQAQEKVARLEEKRKQGRINIREAVELAKAKGEKRADVPSLLTLYMNLAAGPEELDDKLTQYTVVVAQLVDKKSYTPDEAVIRTWNKFKVIETLSQGLVKSPYFPWPPVPDQLLPLREDEILVHTHGGVVTTDGVEVIQKDTDVPSFQKSQKYLLVLSYDPPTKKGILEMGPQSLLRINVDNSLDESEDKHPLQQLVKERYVGSIAVLKQRLMQQPHK
jgi:hypothetical protein